MTLVGTLVRMNLSERGSFMALLNAEQPMAKDRKNLPVRIDEESIKWGKIAASYKDMTLSDYVSEVVLEAARRDVELSHAEMTKVEPASMSSGEDDDVNVAMPKRTPKRTGGR
jgi:uncharacterized protein (DUF1778 family)